MDLSWEQLEAARPGAHLSPEARAQAELDALVTGFATLFGSDARASRDTAGTPCIDVHRSAWIEAAHHARDRVGMTFFDWLSAVDQPDGDPPGVDVVVHVATPPRPVAPATPAATATPAAAATPVRRLLLRTRLPDGAELPSLTPVWPGAAWHERETHEMFGVVFTGFDDGTAAGLRPLLLPDGFEGTPLRKSFELASRAAKVWPGAKEPGESDSTGTTRSPGRRKVAPPGVPDPVTWGPREPGPGEPGPGQPQEPKP